MRSRHDTAACGENAGGAEISEQRRLVASERMERANRAMGLPPPKPATVKPALRKDIDRVKAKLKAQNLIIAQGRTPQAKIKATHTKAGHKKLAVKDSSKYIKTNIKAPREQSAEQSAASRI